MRWVFTQVLFLAAMLAVHAQPTFVDVAQIRQALKEEKNGEQRVLLMVDMARAFLNTSMDSSYYYVNAAKTQAAQIKDEPGKYKAIYIEALIHKYAGDKAGTLELFHEVLNEQRGKNDSSGAAVIEMNIGQVLTDEGRSEEAFPYLTNAQAVLKISDPDHSMGILLHTLGRMYMNEQRYDSAESCFKQTYSYATPGLLPALNASMGDLFRIQGNYTMMRLYYADARLALLRSQEGNSYGMIDLGIAQSVAMQELPDSAITLANYAMTDYNLSGDAAGKAKTALLLASLYNGDSSGVCNKKNKDSTIKYLKMALHINETVFSQEAARKEQVQYMKNIAEDKQRAAEEKEAAHKRNSSLQLAGIGAFIPLFFGLVLWMGKIKLRKRVLAFMAALSLLFVFEFITLLLHPVFGQWTHESPFLMFLLLVLVASVLVPMHHKSEKWLMAKLAHSDDAPNALPDIEPPAVAVHSEK